MNDAINLHLFTCNALPSGNDAAFLISAEFNAHTRNVGFILSFVNCSCMIMQVANDTIIMLIGLVYCVIQPIIAPLALLYFAVGVLIWKYQVVYVYVPLVESGGKVRPDLFHADMWSCHRVTHSLINAHVGLGCISRSVHAQMFIKHNLLVTRRCCVKHRLWLILKQSPCLVRYVSSLLTMCDRAPAASAVTCI